MYKAFAIGDVGTVLKVPRKERKQIFVTNISVRFGDDVEVLDFSGVDIGGSGLSEKEAAFNAAAELAAMEEAILGMQGGSRKKSKFRPGSKRKKKKKGDSAEGEVESGPGFVVTVAGYSPYGNIGELMDPAGVGDDKKKWGVITRLLHLARSFDLGVVFRNCPHHHWYGIEGAVFPQTRCDRAERKALNRFILVGVQYGHGY